MVDILLVPMQVDALVLKTARSVVQPKADFTKLPYFDGQQDHNADRAYLSEELLAQPFADQSFLLKAGVHLHWALPDGLTGTMSMPIVYREALIGVFGLLQGERLWQHLLEIQWLAPFADRGYWAQIRPKAQRDARTLDRQFVYQYDAIESLLNHPAFLPVPNRWLITRTGVDPTEAWIVESDYLYPYGEGELMGSVAYPVHEQEHQPPFRYIGRKLPYALWQEEGATQPNNYLESPLTAIGYGEPTFAAFYPNCHSLFGLYDSYVGPKTNLTYQVIGWYSDPTLDYLGHFLPFYRTQYQAKHGGDNPSSRQVLDAFQKEFTWTIDDDQEVPSHVVCYGELTITAEPADVEPASVANVTVTVGNSGTEALSAYLAQQIGGGVQKAILEDQIEAAQLSSKLGDRQLDIGPKFYEARHEKGFTAIHAGTLWTVRTQSESDQRADATQAQARQQLTLSPPMAHLLNQANQLQVAYDQVQDDLDTLRDQIFADWYKYQICAYPPEEDKSAYPDIDTVKDYIERRDLAYYDVLTRQVGVLALQPQSDSAIAVDLANTAGSLAGQLANALNELWQAVQEHNRLPAIANKDARYVLQQVAAPRYWQPNEPTILLTGPDARFTERMGQDGRHHPDDLLRCQLLHDPTLSPTMADNLTRIQQEIDTLRAANATSETANIAFQRWDQQPWHPFLLEWSAEFFPAVDKQRNQYGQPLVATYLTDNYDLAPNRVEVTPQGVAYGKGANTYLGSTLVTPHSGKILKARLTETLVRLLRSDAAQPFAQALPATIKEANHWLKTNIGQVVTSYTESLAGWVGEDKNAPFATLVDRSRSQIQQTQQSLTTALTSPSESATTSATTSTTASAMASELNTLRRTLQIATLAQAYQRLLQTNAISQSLSGFNAALLMQKQTLQLRVADPLAFGEYQNFATRVRAAVQTGKRTAPQPLNDFNPIRAGALDLLELRLVDTFGQVRTMNHTEILTTEQLRSPGHNVPIYLPPRLAQPARLNFRWLSANHDDLETNDHPATSSICGWLLPNHLDNSIMVYDQAGKALGSLVANDTYAPWRPAPGHDLRLLPGQISNPHLRRLIQFLADEQLRSEAGKKEEDPTYLDNFRAVLDSALENIEPENFAHHQSQALLMGQPIALVRATLSLEQQGLPAHHQSWSAFIQDLQRIERDTLGVESVRIPVRIGENQQLNDGLVGYWIETAEGYAGNLFYSPQSHDETAGDSITDDRLVTHDEGDGAGRRIFNRLCTLADEPLILTLLMDPRGAIHATSALLPTKAIQIPPDHYSKALERIEITFLTAPLLTAAGQIDLSLPKEAGYVWSWLERERDGWREVGMVGKLTWGEVAQAFPGDGSVPGDATPVWDRLQAAGWIDLQADKCALVRAQDRRTEADLGVDFKDLLPKIEDLLAGTQMGHFKPEAHFARQQEVREGWIKLRKE